MTTFYCGITSFFASKVDDRIGATYMSMMWTITNLSGLINDTFAMFLVGKFEVLSFVAGWDAYHYLLAIIMLISILWYICFTISVFRLHHTDKSEWKISFKSSGANPEYKKTEKEIN